jgi:hypothetical protein
MSYASTDTFPAILKTFGEAIGIPELELDDSASCLLAIDELLLNLQWLAEAETLLVYAPIGAMDHGPNALALYEMLLKANCIGKETGSLTLGIHPELDSIILSGRILLQDLDAERLYKYVEFFADQGKTWTDRIKEGTYATQKYLSQDDFDATSALRI